MKTRIQWLLVLVTLLLANACANRQPLSAHDEQRVRATINDRSTWVDHPIF